MQRKVRLRCGDPGDEQVVGVVDEMVASERVYPVVVASQVRGGDGDELAVPGVFPASWAARLAVPGCELMRPPRPENRIVLVRPAQMAAAA